MVDWAGQEDESRGRPDSILSFRLDIHHWHHSDTNTKLDNLIEMVQSVLEREQDLMTAQDDVNAAVTQLGVDVGALNAAAVRIQAEMERLKAEGVDVSGLIAALSELDTATGQLANISPENQPVAEPVVAEERVGEAPAEESTEVAQEENR